MTASGDNSDMEPGTLIAHAYCDKHRLRLKVSVSSEIDNDFTELTATCPASSEAVWGGFDSTPVADDVFLSLGSSREDKRSWTAAAIQVGDPSTFTVFAYCAKDEPKLKTKSASVTLGADELGSATAKCRRGREAVSGGYLQPDGFSTSGGSEIYFFESYRVGKRKWTASGVNSGDPATLTAYAYCEKKRKK